MERDKSKWTLEEVIKEINNLAAVKKIRELTKNEKEYREQLKEFYIKNIKANVEQQLQSIKPHANKIKEAAEDQVEKVKPLVNKVKEVAEEQVEKIKPHANKIKEVAEEQVEKIKPHVNKIKEVAEDQVEKVKPLVSKAREGIEDQISKIDLSKIKSNFKEFKIFNKKSNSETELNQEDLDEINSEIENKKENETK